MRIARVIGTVVAPVKHPFFEGKTLLLVQPEDPHGRAVGSPVVAADRAQAGVGDKILLLTEGSSCRDLFEAEEAPVHSAAVGVIDFVEMEGKQVYPPEA